VDAEQIDHAEGIPWTAKVARDRAKRSTPQLTKGKTHQSLADVGERLVC